MYYRSVPQLSQISNFEDFRVVPYENQDFEKLKQECLYRRILFEDPLFPATRESLTYTRPAPYGVVWKRPSEIVKYPVFIDGQANASDLDQGELGNCWFIAGCAAVTLVPELFNKVVPPYQSLSGPDYAGILHFRFWIYGQWCDVVIDDRLPVTLSNKLLFCRNRENPNEFWGALLEKAYAKVALCYENLDGGCTTDALIDMSGGIDEVFNIKKMQNEMQKSLMWDVLVKSRQHKSLIGASISPDPRIREARLYNGLVMGHAYTVTKVALIEKNGREIKLIRIRNPWGNEVEWNGAWSDRSYEWFRITTDLKNSLEYYDKPDGEYWMSFDDFYRYFENIEICSLTPDAFSAEFRSRNPNLHLKWNTISYHGKWVMNESAGGSGQYDKEAYWLNPQFLITLVDVDPYDNESLATIIVSLMQKHTKERRIKRNGEQAEEFIQFRLYKVKNKIDAIRAKESGCKLYANQLEPCGTSGPYINLRDITKRFRLPPGDYMIIPSCYDKNTPGEFLLRLFTEQEISIKHYTALEEPKTYLKRSDMFFSGRDRDSLYSSWSNLLDSDYSQTEWKSKYARNLIRSRSMFSLQLPYRDDNALNVYDKVSVHKKSIYGKSHACKLM